MMHITACQRRDLASRALVLLANAGRRVDRAFAVAAVSVAVLAVTLDAPAARADGGYLPFPGYDLWEPGQTAFLDYDATTGTETLSILPRFAGDAADFAWVVPVPSLPAVAAADPEVFNELSRLTVPPTRSRDGLWQCQRGTFEATGADSQEDGGVEIVDQRVVGIYRTTTIGADDATALLDSLTAWGFLWSGNRDAVAPVLQDYVDDGWYFVAMAVDSAAVAAVNPPSAKAASSLAPYWDFPALQPITFTFASDTIIYPLRISRISTHIDNGVTLYVAADHRVEFAGARTLYANRLTAAEHAAILRHFPRIGVALAPGRFLTRLYRNYGVEALDGDLVLTRAADDTEYLPLRYSGLPVWSLVYGGSILAWLAWRFRRRRDRRSAGTGSS